MRTGGMGQLLYGDTLEDFHIRKFMIKRKARLVNPPIPE
jgi:hypothetical protein